MFTYLICLHVLAGLINLVSLGIHIEEGDNKEVVTSALAAFFNVIAIYCVIGLAR